MVQIRISPDLRIVSDKLSKMATDLLGPIIQEVVNEVAPEIESAMINAAPVGPHNDASYIKVTPTFGLGRGARLTITGPGRLNFALRGTRPHVIEAVNGKYLAFVDRSGTLQFRHSVMHPGQAPNPFVERAWSEVQPQISASIRAAGLRAWRDLAHFQ